MWRADLVRTRTGQVGARIDVESGTGPSDEINGVPSASVNLRRSLAERIPVEWWQPWRNSIVLAHRHRTTDAWKPIMGGPIVHYPTLGAEAIKIDVAGIQEILRHRVRTHEWSQFASPSAWLRSSFYMEGALGQISWAVIEEALAKPRGGLPIIHGTVTETVTDGTRKGRGWGDWDLGKANVWDQVLKGLREEDGGPDMRFTPRYAAGTDRRIEWVYEHGTHHDPRIAHPYTLRLDATAARSAVSDVDVTMSGLATAHRVYGTGAGEGPGTWVRVAEDLSLTVDEMPLIEAVVSDTSASSAAEVQALAQGGVSAGELGAWEVACTIHTSPGLPLWQVRVGAPVQIKIKDRHPFPDGWQRGRIRSVTYSLTSDAVAVTIEEAP